MGVGGQNPDDIESAQDPEVMPTLNRTDVASAAVTSSGTSATFESAGFGCISFIVNITAASGTNPTLEVDLQSSDDGSNWDTLISTETFVGADVQAIKSVAIASRKYRFNYTITGTTPSFTFSIITTLKPYLPDESIQTFAYGVGFVNVATAAVATDVITLTGSATKTISVSRIKISGISSNGSNNSVLLIKRSSANSGGTSSTLTSVQFDPDDPSASAIVKAYTANPTSLGSAVGTFRSERVLFSVASGGGLSGFPYEEIFSPNEIMLRGTGDTLAVNLNGVTVVGGSLSGSIDWNEF